MLFLLRCTERGKEPHAAKSKLRHDIADLLLAAVPDARLTFDVGRIYVDVDRDITPELARLHGVASFSPCIACDLGDLQREVLAVAARRLTPGSTFRVKVRRAGAHPFTSSEKAAELGAEILAHVPGARVDLRASPTPSPSLPSAPPDPSTPPVAPAPTSPAAASHLDLVIEIRDRLCHVCTAVIPGIDARRDEPLDPDVPPDPTSAEPRFLVDAMLGTLASRLRAFGYDTEWRRDTADSLLLREAAAQRRIVLTQDRELAEIGARSAYFVHGKTVDDQLDEVLTRFALTPRIERLFTRCSVCNTPLEPIERETARPRVPPRAFAHHDQFWTCRPCDKIYWKGSHYDEMLTLLESAKARRESAR